MFAKLIKFLNTHWNTRKATAAEKRLTKQLKESRDHFALFQDSNLAKVIGLRLEIASLKEELEKSQSAERIKQAEIDDLNDYVEAVQARRQKEVLMEGPHVSRHT